jgi:aspartyl/glutamyl-tRNA(Asn/Gln) amidotransferase C subunit
MARFTKEMVDSYADKLLIGLTPEENKMVLDEFEVIDNDIDVINTIDNIQNVEPMTHALDNFKYELREDIADKSPSVDELLRNAKKTMGSEIEVPKVVE